MNRDPLHVGLRIIVLSRKRVCESVFRKQKRKFRKVMCRITHQFSDYTRKKGSPKLKPSQDRNLDHAVMRLSIIITTCTSDG